MHTQNIWYRVTTIGKIHLLSTCDQDFAVAISLRFNGAVEKLEFANQKTQKAGGA